MDCRYTVQLTTLTHLVSLDSDQVEAKERSKLQKTELWSWTRAEGGQGNRPVKRIRAGQAVETGNGAFKIKEKIIGSKGATSSQRASRLSFCSSCTVCVSAWMFFSRRLLAHVGLSTHMKPSKNS